LQHRGRSSVGFQAQIRDNVLRILTRVTVTCSAHSSGGGGGGLFGGGGAGKGGLLGGGGG